MLSLNDLQSFQTDLNQRQSARSQLGEQSYREGLQLLERYNQQPGPDVLLQAMARFIDCTTQQRRRLEPLVILGYIHYALNSYQAAARYYQLAAAIDATAPQVLRLQEILSGGEPVPTIAEARHPEPEAVMDAPEAQPAEYRMQMSPEARYDDAEDRIAAEIRTLHATTVSLGLVLGPELEHISRTRDALAKRLAAFEQDLASLREDYDTQAMQNQLGLIEIRLRQYDRLLALSREAEVVIAEIGRFQLEIELRLDGEPLREQELDPILDACDRLADRIDALEARGCDIELLKAPYRQLSEVVQQFMDQLDDQLN